LSQDIRRETKLIMKDLKDDSGFIMIERDCAELPSDDEDYSDADIFSD